jgi:hypothetical protein
MMNPMIVVNTGDEWYEEVNIGKRLKKSSKVKSGRDRRLLLA